MLLPESCGKDLEGAFVQIASLVEATGVLEQDGQVVANLRRQNRIARQRSLADKERCPVRPYGGLGVAPITTTGSVVTEPAYDNACEPNSRVAQSRSSVSL